jgi:hypothetical protein
MFPESDGDRGRTASTPVVVTGEPITGLRLVVQDPLRVPVAVAFEDAGSAQPERVFVSAQSEHGMGGNSATLRDGRLTLEVPPGTYRIFASAGGQGAAGPHWFVKGVTYRGREVGDDEVQLTAEPGGRIDVVFTTRASVVTGGVTDGRGSPAMDYTVILFPADPQLLARAAFRRLHVVRADQHGRFQTKGLPPGEYLAAAIQELDVEDVFEPEFLESLRPVATAFELADTGTATLSLRLAALP